MEASTFKILHLLGLFMVLISLGGMAVSAKMSAGGTHLKQAFAWNGIGLLIMLFSGLAMVARLGLAAALPVWIILKVLIWVALVSMTMLIKRKPDLGTSYWWMALALAGTAAYLALFQPF